MGGIHDFLNLMTGERLIINNFKPHYIAPLQWATVFLGKCKPYTCIRYQNESSHSKEGGNVMKKD